MPIPQSPYEVTFTFWLFCGGFALLFGLVTFFLVRFVRQTDYNFTRANKRIDGQADAMIKNTQNMKEVLAKFQDTAEDMRTKSFESQTKVNDQLHNINKQSVEIERILLRTQEKANHIEEKFGMVSDKVDELDTRIEKLNHKTQLNDDNIKEIKQKISEFKIVSN